MLYKVYGINALLGLSQQYYGESGEQTYRHEAMLKSITTDLIKYPYKQALKSIGHIHFWNLWMK